MTEVFVVRNQHGLFANKHKEWVDGREPKLLFRSEHKDEAINLVFELSSKDIYLRASAISVELDNNKQPVVEVTAPPPGPEHKQSDTQSTGNELNDTHVQGSIDLKHSDASSLETTDNEHNNTNSQDNIDIEHNDTNFLEATDDKHSDTNSLNNIDEGYSNTSIQNSINNKCDDISNQNTGDNKHNGNGGQNNSSPPTSHHNIIGLDFQKKDTAVTEEQ